MAVSTSPVHVDAALDPHLNRWLWLVKWLLAIPHVIALVLLWAAFAVLSVVAFFAILFTGRYPRPIFDFNVGVLRWTWRVAFYAYGALGTDRYPPFSLEEQLDYPANLQVEYPEHLSRGLVLVKWWLLAIPHYVVVGFFLGGGIWLAGEAGETDRPWAWGSGLVGLLVLVAAVVLLFTGRYPRSIFDLVLGMQRWILRVAAYAALMTDTYPPFRLDLGGSEPTLAHLTVPDADTPGVPPATETPDTGPTPGPQEAADVTRWTGGRVVTVTLGALVIMLGLGLLGGAGTTFVVDHGLRESGFVTSPVQTLRSPTYAIVSEAVIVEGLGVAGGLPEQLLGQARVRATAGDDSAVFVGIAPAADVRAYLDGVPHTTVTQIGDNGDPVYRNRAGERGAAAPADVDIWVVQASGTGTQAVTWTPEDGAWNVVVMNRDATRGVDVSADAGVELPFLGWVPVILLATGAVFLAVGTLLVVLAVPRRRAQS